MDGMYDPVTLDQLRALVAVVEAGSFSAAARRLQRVQSAVSTSMANLEGHLGVGLFDRSTKVPTLTEQGVAVLGAARRVLAEVDALRRLAGGMSQGLEAQVSLCVDAFFPLPGLIALAAAFTRAFPSVDLRVDTQVLSAVARRVLEGRASMGVATPFGVTPDLETIALAPIRMVPVAAPGHPLAAVRGRIPSSRFADCIQIVLSERTEEGIADQAVLSPRTWRASDLHTKHELLLAGLGWGNMPEHVVTEDLRSRRLVRIRPAPWGDFVHTVPLSAIHRRDAGLGPAHRWILGQLPIVCAGGAPAADPEPTDDQPAAPRRAGPPRGR